MKQSEKKHGDKSIKVCLTVAGLDPSGGAGIIADAGTFRAFGCFPLAAVSSLTFQNTQGVFGAVNQSAETVRGQIEPLIEDFEISAVKTGMLPNAEVIETVAKLIEKNKLKNLVVDPVLRSTSGYALIDENAVEALIEFLFPLAMVVTPNIPEAERLAGIKITNEADRRRAAKIIQNLGAKSVVIKGGHFPQVDKTSSVDDFLLTEKRELVFPGKHIPSEATHGTGCVFAAAVAACLARGKDLEKSVETAKKFVSAAIRTATRIGRGVSPVNHSVKGFDKF